MHVVRLFKILLILLIQVVHPQTFKLSIASKSSNHFYFISYLVKAIFDTYGDYNTINTQNSYDNQNYNKHILVICHKINIIYDNWNRFNIYVNYYHSKLYHLFFLYVLVMISVIYIFYCRLTQSMISVHQLARHQHAVKEVN